MKIDHPIAAAILLAGLLATPAMAQTAGTEAGAARPAPPDVSRITIRRPSSDIVEPESFRRPVALPPEGAAQGEDGDIGLGEGGGGLIVDDGTANLDDLGDLTGRIVRTEGPGVPAAPIGGVPNTTAADVNDPGVRIRIPASN